MVRISLDNLARLGLIEIRNNEHYSNDNVYNDVRNNVYYKTVKERLQSDSVGQVVENKKLLKCTELSTLFYKLCVKD